MCTTSKPRQRNNKNQTEKSQTNITEKPKKSLLKYNLLLALLIHTFR